MPYTSNMERESEAKSREAGKAELVIKLLNRKTGKVSDKILAKIEALPIEQLEKLGEDLLDFTGSGDLVDWLQKYGEAGN